MSLRRWLPLAALLAVGSPAEGLSLAPAPGDPDETRARPWPASEIGTRELPALAASWPADRVRFRARGLGALRAALEPALAPALPRDPGWLRFETLPGSDAGLGVYVRAAPTPETLAPERATTLISLLGVAPEILLESGPFRALLPLGPHIPAAGPGLDAAAPLEGTPVAALEPVPEPMTTLLVLAGLVFLALPVRGARLAAAGPRQARLR